MKFHEDLSQLLMDYGLPTEYVNDLTVDHEERQLHVRYVVTDYEPGDPPCGIHSIGFDQHPKGASETPIYDSLKAGAE